jgi:hypothetical protein
VKAAFVSFTSNNPVIVRMVGVLEAQDGVFCSLWIFSCYFALTVSCCSSSLIIYSLGKEISTSVISSLLSG